MDATYMNGGGYFGGANHGRTIVNVGGDYTYDEFKVQVKQLF